MKTAVYVRAFNENNIIEWMTYYYKCGFDFIVFIDDYSEPSIKSVIEQYGKFEESRYIVYNNPLPKLGTTMTSFNEYKVFDEHTMPIFKKHNIDYVLMIDMDEYLFIDKYNNIKELIDDYKQYDQIYITYKNFGHNFVTKNDSNELVKHFTKCANFITNCGKSLAKVSSIESSASPHYFKLLDGKMTVDQYKNIININKFDAHGQLSSTLENSNNSNIYVAHYYTQDIYTNVMRRLVFKQNFIAPDYVIQKFNVKQLLVEESVESIVNHIEQFDYKNNNLGFSQTDTLKDRLTKFFWQTNCCCNSIVNNDIINFYNSKHLLFFNRTHVENSTILIPDIYFSCQYGEACECADDAVWEICVYNDLMYVYLKREYKHNGISYYDLLTPYGYSGYYFSLQSTYDEFIPLFREEALKRNYITEVVRQNPYLNINIHGHYDIITSRTIFGVDLTKYNNLTEYLCDCHKDNKRGYGIAQNSNLMFKFENFDENNLNNFLEIYNSTMDVLNSTKYYYFNDAYYKSLANMKNNILFANVYNSDVLIASCMIFKYNKLLHYHIGGSLCEYRNLRPNNYLHCNVIKYGIEYGYTLYVIGGGLKNNDSLFEFKNKIKNTEFNYTIYKNVLNDDVYDEIKSNYEDTGYFPIHRK